MAGCPNGGLNVSWFDIFNERFCSDSIRRYGKGQRGLLCVLCAGSRDALAVSADVGDLGTAACWILLDKLTGKYAYVSNNPSNTISSYTLKADGTVTLLDAVAAPVRGPNDLAGAVENGASFMYVVNAGKKTIEAFQINSDGSLNFLVPWTSARGFPAGSAPQGIAAY